MIHSSVLGWIVREVKKGGEAPVFGLVGMFLLPRRSPSRTLPILDSTPGLFWFSPIGEHENLPG